MLITWLAFGKIMLETWKLYGAIFIQMCCVFFKVKDSFGHISKMFGMIDMKRK